jgi:hypothetical protein
MQKSQQRLNRRLIASTVAAAAIAVAASGCSQPAPVHHAKVVAHKKVSAQVYQDKAADGSDRSSYYLPTYDPGHNIILWWTLVQPPTAPQPNFTASRTTTLSGTWSRLPSTFIPPGSLDRTGAAVAVNARFGVPVQEEKPDGTQESETVPVEEVQGSVGVVIDVKTTPQEAQEQEAEAATAEGPDAAPGEPGGVNTDSGSDAGGAPDGGGGAVSGGDSGGGGDAGGGDGGGGGGGGE